ncbi:MAG: heme-binding protein, partial [Pseudomonadales bacterium]
MSASVTYDPIFGSSTIDDYLAFWTTGFATAGHGDSNTGGFSNGTFSGDQYATHGANNSDYAFIADSDVSNGLNYVFDFTLPSGDNQNHYLYGQLDNVSLGEVLGG